MFYLFQQDKRTITEIFKMKEGTYKTKDPKVSLPAQLAIRVLGFNENHILIKSDDYVELVHPSYDYKISLSLEGDEIILDRRKI